MLLQAETTCVRTAGVAELGLPGIRVRLRSANGLANPGWEQPASLAVGTVHLASLGRERAQPVSLTLGEWLMW